MVWKVNEINLIKFEFVYLFFFLSCGYIYIYEIIKLVNNFDLEILYMWDDVCKL